MTQKYFGSRNDSLQLWLYQRASLLHQAKFLTGDPTLLLVHGMDDTLVTIDHTMQLARVSCELLYRVMSFTSPNLL